MGVAEADERALVLQAQRGEEAAFERLFAAHQVRVYTLVRYVVGDPTEAEDVTQRAFVRAWEELPRLRDPQAFTAWLNRIARNMALDQARMRAARLRLEGGAPDPPEQADAQAWRSDEGLVGQERTEQVHRAIASLSEAHQEVVVMHHLEGMPVEGVGARLRVPVGTVLSRLARARAVLRRKLAPYVEADRP